jgi:hypothetical protein
MRRSTPKPEKARQAAAAGKGPEMVLIPLTAAERKQLFAAMLPPAVRAELDPMAVKWLAKLILHGE